MQKVSRGRSKMNDERAEVADHFTLYYVNLIFLLEIRID